MKFKPCAPAVPAAPAPCAPAPCRFVAAFRASSSPHRIGIPLLRPARSPPAANASPGMPRRSGGKGGDMLAFYSYCGDGLHKDCGLNHNFVVKEVTGSDLQTVRDPTSWTINRHDGRDHLGLRCDALPEH